MGRPRVVVSALAVSALTLAAAACSGQSKGGGGDGAASGKSLSIATGAEVPRLNPADDNGTTGIQIESAIWAPLVKTDPKTGKLDYVVAQSITTKDARTWTIRLRPGWTFSNGEKLTAQAFVDTWNYTAYGPHGYANNGAFQRFAGYPAMNPTKGKPAATKLSGLKAVDASTIQVTLAKPFSPFPTTLQYLGYAALAPSVLKNPGAYDHKPIGYGPYKIDGSWKTGQSVNLTRNSAYPAKPVPQAQKISFRWFANPETGYNEFLAGNIDYSSVPATKLSAYKTDAAGKYGNSKASGNVWYIVPPVTKKGFSDSRIRRALSLALDRTALAKLQAGGAPATSYISPGIVGYRAGACTECKQDVAKAKQLLKQAGGFPGTLKMYYNSDSSGSQVFVEAVGNMWRQNLGLKIAYIGKPSSETGDLADKDKLDGTRIMGWGHDYPSIEDYLTPIFASYGDANFNHYKNPKVDKLLDDANSTSNQAAAIKKYQHIEDVLLADMPELPAYRVTSPYLHAQGVNPRNSPYTGVDPIWSTFTR